MAALNCCAVQAAAFVSDGHKKTGIVCTRPTAFSGASMGKVVFNKRRTTVSSIWGRIWVAQPQPGPVSSPAGVNCDI